ncbi:MAG: hypothetical protein ACRDT0_17645 [Pseudonocardiaceae bacterium]
MLELAREPLWVTEIDESFRSSTVEFEFGDLRGPMPILAGDRRDPVMVIDQDLMHGTTRAARALLDKIILLFQERRNSYVLTPGDVLVIDNRRAMHGVVPSGLGATAETAFIVRCFTVADLGRLRDARLVGTRTVAAISS